MAGGTVGSDCQEEGYISGEYCLLIGQCMKEECMYVITVCESITHSSLVRCLFKTRNSIFLLKIYSLLC